VWMSGKASAAQCGSTAAGFEAPRTSLPPEILEARRRQLGIAHRVLDVAVSKVGLERPRIVPSVRQRIAASVMIDNLPAHKAPVREAIEARGAMLRYLPKYSPDLNPAAQAADTTGSAGGCRSRSKPRGNGASSRSGATHAEDGSRRTRRRARAAARCTAGARS
jgi:hypothetical protein